MAAAGWSSLSSSVPLSNWRGAATSSGLALCKLRPSRRLSASVDFPVRRRQRAADQAQSRVAWPALESVGRGVLRHPRRGSSVRSFGQLADCIRGLGCEGNGVLQFGQSGIEFTEIHEAGCRDSVVLRHVRGPDPGCADKTAALPGLPRRTQARRPGAAQVRDAPGLWQGLGATVRLRIRGRLSQVRSARASVRPASSGCRARAALSIARACLGFLRAR